MRRGEEREGEESSVVFHVLWLVTVCCEVCSMTCGGAAKRRGRGNVQVLGRCEGECGISYGETAALATKDKRGIGKDLLKKSQKTELLQG
ncbi:hypothetical protein E2C01_041845 [Portunus trituberculatus]|uniref:Uncharacterized protein n=1 Tax=Portunus trituberculatus TaxID=210409 RepID=A0A5B7FK95_PORTR|nr:hypothetical protein [Portunus trituberculatus]